MNTQPSDKHRKAGNESDKIYLTDNSTLQTPEEEQLDKNRKQRNEDEVIETHTVEDVDLDAIVQTDRAGTNERKP